MSIPSESLVEKDIRRALARLVSGGRESLWLPEVQPLLQLSAVKERVDAGQKPDKALREVLLEAIDELGQSQYRHLLEIVLGLDPESAELSAGERRALAGKRFRGGKRPVTAGTIRQHHERRALDELAERLTARFGPDAGDRPQEQDWLEWHPAVREAWAGQRLNLWRISISEYQTDEVREVLSALMRRHRVGAWAVFEMFGVFDLLVEAWLPADVRASTLENELEEGLGGRLVRCDGFAVDEIVTHWVWRDEQGEMQAPPRSVLEETPSERQLALLRAGDERQLSRFIASHAAARVVAAPGIGLLIAVGGTQGHPLLSVAERELVKDLIIRLIAETDPGVLSQVVLARGSGFADYVLQGQVAPEAFHRMNERLVKPLNEAVRSAGLRAHTFVFAASEPLIRHQGLDWMPPAEERLSARDLLLEGESPMLEVRTSAFADLLHDDQVGATWADSGAAKGLMRAVVAMLNGNGGTVVLGACPQSRAEGDPRFTGKRRKGAPVVGEFMVVGVDDEIAGKPDSYLRKVAAMCRRFVEPDPRLYIELRLERIEDRTVLVVAVADPPDEWFYFVDHEKEPAFLVRNSAGMSEHLRGLEGDKYKRSFPRY